MITPNLIQFAPIFDAVGAKINLHTKSMSCEVAEAPSGKHSIVSSAANDIGKFLDTRTYQDGPVAFAIASFIDGNANPIDSASRESILEYFGVKQAGKYISSVLSVQKINKSWHTSDVPNECTAFDSLCTHRGVTDVRGKRGRKSTRNPEEYHEKKSNGIIAREQLVTPSIEALWRAIPDGVMVTAAKPKNVFRMDEIENLDIDTIEEILERINSMKAGA